MSDVLVELDRLIDQLDGNPPGPRAPALAPPLPGDAIDAVLAAPPRQTAVRSLKADPAVQAFRQELTDGLIRVDTLNRLLVLVNTVVSAMMAGR